MSRYHEILKRYWGYDDFRGVQETIVRSIGSGRDTLGLMPTGGGKSIAFQVPALAQEGLCLVVTPLIALMKDQVRHLRERGIKAVAIYTGLTRQEILVALENCIYGNYKFLYISPERLASELFLAKLSHMPVSMITVDEAHCISQWGYDFRPSYLNIADIRKLLPGVPVLALTATATPNVVKDIQERLGFAEENVCRMSFERKNLAYVVRPTDAKIEELLHILDKVPGSAIIYTRSRNRTREVAEYLCRQGIRAEYYHAGLPHVEKDEKQRRWQSGTSRVMVATNAFGMGIDKADVRLVVHVDLPDSPEAYFQEAGRAGRDGLLAYAVLLVGSRDVQTLKQRVSLTYPDKDFIRDVYEHLSYYYQIAMGGGAGETHEFDIDVFCRNFKHFPVPVDSALRLLTQAGYIEYIDERENVSRLMFTVRRDELYNMNDNPESDKVIRAILRNYSGLFTDYAYIDEHLLARHAGLTYHELYEQLRALSLKRIIHYIPHKSTPLIRYSCRREEKERLLIPPSVYEERKSDYEMRIAAMVDYVTSTDTCRSRMLLDYFGERDSHACGHCDVCIARRQQQKERSDKEIASRLFALFAQEEKLRLGRLMTILSADFTQSAVTDALRALEQEGRITIADEYVRLTSDAE